MTRFTALSEPDYDAQHIDPAAEVEPGPELLDQLLGAGWRVMGATYVDTRSQYPGVRQTRVVLVNRALGKELFGFGGDWEEAFEAAAWQIK